MVSLSLLFMDYHHLSDFNGLCAHLLSEFFNDCVVVVVRECTVRAVLDTVREHFRVTRTFGHVVQRAVTEHAAEIFGLVRFMAREILAVSVAKKICAVLHAMTSFRVVKLSGLRVTVAIIPAFLISFLHMAHGLISAIGLPSASCPVR